MKKKFTIGLSLFCCIALNAQDFDGNYLHIDAGCGVHHLSNDAGSSLQKDNRPGYTFQAGYSYFFSPSWGIQSGLGIKTFSSATTIDLQTTESALDKLNRTYEFRTKFDNWKETEKAVFLTIPVELQYRYPVSDHIAVIGSLGGEMAFPVYKQFSSAGQGTIVTTGYYGQWNTELSDLPDYGFSTYSDMPKGKLPLTSVSCSGIADVGGLIRINDQASLYIGSYLNLGLNNIRKSGSNAIYKSDGTYNGIYASSQLSKIIPVAVGLKIGVYLNMGKHKNTK